MANNMSEPGQSIPPNPDRWPGSTEENDHETSFCRFGYSSWPPDRAGGPRQCKRDADQSAIWRTQPRTPRGIVVLDRRIEQAARKACGYGKVTTGTRIPSRKASKCVDELVAKAHQQFAALTGKQEKGG